MWWFIAYVVGYLATACWLGRNCAKDFERDGRLSHEASPLQFALGYSLVWPAVLLLIGGLLSYESLKDVPVGKITRFFRRVFTGTDKDFKPVDRVGTTY
jgi:hypothetical protein